MNLLNEVSYVKRGKNRAKVFRAIDKPIMPSELVMKIYGKKSNTYFNMTSRALNELLKEKLVLVANPSSKTGRLYVLTEKGKKVLEILNQ